MASNKNIPSPNYPIFNMIKYYRGISQSVDNIQKMHGVMMEVYRIKKKEENPYVKSFGPHQVNLKSTEYSEKVMDIELLSTPQELYTTYIVGSGNSELDVYCKNKDLEIGDILRYRWVEDQVLEFTIIEMPRNFGDIYFAYRIKSTYQVK